jgi:outer membrane receptor protein involved in Fe transport
MQLIRCGAASGFVALACVTLVPRLSAQTPASFSLTVEDSRGRAVEGAAISDAAGKVLGRTGADGQMEIACAAPCRVTVAADGFASQTVSLSAAATIELQPAAVGQEVTVTAYRTPMGELESPATTRALSQQALESSATVTLDDQMRQLPGVEMFRRSSSLVANPTSQGISLRGLGSTSASRTLVTEDDVPLNDALGGWIHWQEQPELAMQDIELVRGGASDLYGSSAIGGVINVMLVRPESSGAELSTSYGGEGTYDEDLLADAKAGPWGLLGAAGLIGTDGYIQEAPSQRGPVDVASFVHSHNGLVLAEHERGALRLFARGSGFNESRGNGTPYQVNATRLWRYATGADWKTARDAALALRLYGSWERYRQTFSSISNLPDFGNASCVYRCGEIPTKLSIVPDNELGAAAHWSEPLGAGLLLLAGADTHDVRVWDREQTYGATAALTNLHDHQRDSAGYLEAMWVRNAWTLVAGARVDWFQNYDGQLLDWNGSAWTPAASQPPQRGQRLFDPRLGLSRKLGGHWALSASGFRAFREPTPNELYRSTQVGNELTLPNGNLLSERATGWETGVGQQRAWGTVRASYFLTEVNRPITALTTNPASSPILLVRENLGQIQSRGVAVDFEIAPRRWIGLDGGYQYAHATVTRGSQDLGNWIPEVARNMATLNLHASKPRVGTLSLQSRLSGRMFDDDANDFLLHGYFRLDAFASHDFGSRFEIFAAGQNLTNRAIEDSKTPTTTLGMPRLARAGILVRLGEAGR